MLSMDALDTVYPDARFVMTHRDPAKVIPSACSVIVEHTRMRLPDFDPDPAQFGQEVLGHLLGAATRGMAARAEIGEDRFIDVGQPELHTDPLGVAERIYDFAGIELTGEVRAAMAEWTGRADVSARGGHRYTAEEFGLAEEGIREAFSGYLDRFGDYCLTSR